MGCLGVERQIAIKRMLISIESNDYKWSMELRRRDGPDLVYWVESILDPFESALDLIGDHTCQMWGITPETHSHRLQRQSQDQESLQIWEVTYLQEVWV